MITTQHQRQERRNTAASFMKAAIQYLKLPDAEAYGLVSQAVCAQKTIDWADVQRERDLTDAVALAIMVGRIPLSMFLPVITKEALVHLPHHVAQAIFEMTESGVYSLSNAAISESLRSQWKKAEECKNTAETHLKIFEGVLRKP